MILEFFRPSVGCEINFYKKTSSLPPEELVWTNGSQYLAAHLPDERFEFF